MGKRVFTHDDLLDRKLGWRNLRGGGCPGWLEIREKHGSVYDCECDWCGEWLSVHEEVVLDFIPTREAVPDEW